MRCITATRVQDRVHPFACSDQCTERRIVVCRWKSFQGRNWCVNCTKRATKRIDTGVWVWEIKKREKRRISLFELLLIYGSSIVFVFGRYLHCLTLIMWGVLNCRMSCPKFPSHMQRVD